MTQKDSENFEVIVSSKEISLIFDVSESRIRQLAKENAVVRVGHGKYDLPKSFKAYINYLESKREEVLDKSIEEAYWTRARREKTELQVQVMKGELHRSEDVERVMNSMLGNFRGKLLAFPPKMAAKVAGKSDLTEIRNLLKSGINEAMTELAEYNPKDFYSDDVVEDDEDDLDG
ncbi:hypothetical protein LG296_01610 [Ureibacillus chungkukjangi]|uniref:hypothetical protein n=1 Tax=Ureibacillus chungkukjangi TaxID=1202712 RepID=UPI00384EF7EC